MSESYKWELVEDGYDREQRYVEWPSGKIVGWTRGSEYDNSGWDAGTDKPIGTFVTGVLAKKAVENAIAKERAK